MTETASTFYNGFYDQDLDGDPATIEQMKSELLKAGWKEKRSTVWQSPWCACYRGPAGAYRIMKTERDHPDPCPITNPKPGDVWGPYRMDEKGWWCLVPSV
jgi:hypothetical protein